MDEHKPPAAGRFVISIDFELIWGTLDLFGPDAFRAACARERRVVERLLDLFCEFQIPATWCVLGHLFLDHCEPVNGCKHPEIERPRHSWCTGDWFQHDTCSCEERDPNFYGKSLIHKIRECPVPQEIGSHSFSHVIFGDRGCSRAAAASDLAACVRLAKELGIELRSFAFPRNRVGHLDLLRQYGFRCYRGPDPCWYESASCPAILKRLGHLWNVLTLRKPPVVVPEETLPGLWSVPGSMIYFPSHGLRRWVPQSFRVKRAIKGLEAAVRSQRIFHLWFHPTNFTDCEDEMFSGLRCVLAHAAALRSRGLLAILPLEAIVRAA